MLKISQKMADRETVGAIFIIAFVSVFILANFIIGFFWPLYILTMTVGAVVAFLFPRSGLLAIVFLTMIFERFFTLASVALGKIEYKIYPLDIFMLAILAGIFHLWIKDKKAFSGVGFQKSDGLILAFIFLNIIYFFSSIFFVDSNTYLSFSTFKNYAFYSLIYFITFLLIRTKEEFEKLFRFFLFGAMGIIGFIIFGAISGQGLWTEYTPLSTSGTRILAFTHGLFLLLAFVSAIVFLSLEKKSKKISRIYFLVVIWFIGILGTMMRHLWVSLGLAFVVLFLLFPTEMKLRFRKQVLGIFSVISFLVLIVFYLGVIFPTSSLNQALEKVSAPVLERGVSIGKANADESFAWRKLVWSGAYDQYKNNLFLGIGTGKMVYVEEETYRDYVEIRNIHNSYLAILIQLGALGISLFLYFVYIVIKNLVNFKDNASSRFYKFSLLGILFVYLTALPFQPYLETNLLALFFWMALGLARNIPKTNLS
jgi:O-antigen ligase